MDSFTAALHSHHSTRSEFHASAADMRWPAGTVLRSASGLAYARGSLGGSAAPAQIAVVLTHALGYCKEIWCPTLHHLSKLVRNRVEFLALDFSGHGASRPPRNYDWNRCHVDEVAEVLRAESLPENLIGVGHSMGGATLVALELRNPGTLSRVAAIEPPLFTRLTAGIGRAATAAGLNPIAAAARRRRRVWPDADAAREHIGRRLAADWDPAALDAYIAHALRPDADRGGVELACDPETEALAVSSPGESVGSLTSGYSGLCAFTLVTCERSRFSPLGPMVPNAPYYEHLIAPALGAAVQRLDGVSHLAPHEDPKAVAALIAAEVHAAVTDDRS